MDTHGVRDAALLSTFGGWMRVHGRWLNIHILAAMIAHLLVIGFFEVFHHRWDDPISSLLLFGLQAVFLAVWVPIVLGRKPQIVVSRSHSPALAPPARVTESVLASAVGWSNAAWKLWGLIWGTWVVLYVGLFSKDLYHAPQNLQVYRLHSIIAAGLPAPASEAMARELETEITRRRATIDVEPLRALLTDIRSRQAGSVVQSDSLGTTPTLSPSPKAENTTPPNIAAIVETLSPIWLIELERTLLDMLNNVQSISVIVLFILLYRPDGDSRIHRAPKTSCILWGGVLGIIECLVRWTLPHLSTHPGPSADSWMLLSGIAAATSLALLVGRIESKLIGPPLTVIAALYIYAAIQPVWDMLAYGSGVARAILSMVALGSKIMLLMMFEWLHDSGVLVFSMLRSTHQAEASVHQKRVKFMQYFLSKVE